MKYVLLVLFILALLIGMVHLLVAVSAFQETGAFIVILISAVFLTGALVIDAVNAQTKSIERLSNLVARYILKDKEGRE